MAWVATMAIVKLESVQGLQNDLHSSTYYLLYIYIHILNNCKIQKRSLTSKQYLITRQIYESSFRTTFWHCKCFVKISENRQIMACNTVLESEVKISIVRLLIKKCVETILFKCNLCHENAIWSTELNNTNGSILIRYRNVVIDSLYEREYTVSALNIPPS